MPAEVIYTEKAPKPVGPYSQAIKVGSFIFGSGQIPIDPTTGNIVKGDITTQTRRVTENIKAVLEAVGYTLSDVVSVNVFLRNLSDYDEFNQIYSEYFKEKISGSKRAACSMDHEARSFFRYSAYRGYQRSACLRSAM